MGPTFRNRAKAVIGMPTLHASLCSGGDCGRRSGQPDRGWPMSPELVLLLSIELDLIIRADPCQARPVATDLGRAL
jgi:hypothetical protein